jgi:hypothetical protein
VIELDWMQKVELRQPSTDPEQGRSVERLGAGGVPAGSAKSVIAASTTSAPAFRAEGDLRAMAP